MNELRCTCHSSLIRRSRICYFTVIVVHMGNASAVGLPWFTQSEHISVQFCFLHKSDCTNLCSCDLEYLYG